MVLYTFHYLIKRALRNKYFQKLALARQLPREIRWHRGNVTVNLLIDGLEVRDEKHKKVSHSRRFVVRLLADLSDIRKLYLHILVHC
jgi:hypothetical protein